jgi:hypothetical protein
MLSQFRLFAKTFLAKLAVESAKQKETTVIKILVESFSGLEHGGLTCWCHAY